MDASNNPFSWPRKTRELQNFLMDSTRWNNFQFRDDDIVIATWSKSGTTWVQQIISQLIFKGDGSIFGQTLSPWIEFQLMPHVVDIAQKQQHRRFLKTHLPLDALVFSPRAKYIYVGRDARDVIFSYHHHLKSFTPFALQKFIEVVNKTGSKMPPPIPDDVGDFYRMWLDNDTHSDNSFWHNVKGWWEVRNLPNVLFVHYANLKADLPGEFRRIANYLDIPIDEDKFSQMLKHCSLDYMKEIAASQEFLELMFQGGGRTFVNKGTNGRWRDVLSPAEIGKCDEMAEKHLPQQCVHWLRTGEEALSYA
ncbi:MAG: sulfotransferase domain-containing protein [Gammaproteobacteria bacterium]